MRRVSGWSFRLIKQAEVSASALFVTLTYQPENVKLSKNGFMTLSKEDVQKFFKRLRKKNIEYHKNMCIKHNKNYEELKIKYYACGEYGGKTNRPHYHIILFNTYPDVIESAWRLDDKEIGHIHIGQVNEASVGYTLKYMCKPSKIPLHRNDDRLKEFALMSKGMGLNYLTEAMKNYHKDADRMFCVLKDGKKISMPRYYKQKIWTDEERQRIGLEYSGKLVEKDLSKTWEELYEEELIRIEKQRKFQKQDSRNQKL